MSITVRPVMVVAVTCATLGSGIPVDRAVGLRELLGFWKLGWLKMFSASIRSCSLPDSHPGILQLLANEKSKFDKSGPRSEFLGLVPKVFSAGAVYASWLYHWLRDCFVLWGFPARLG